jgi:hypothetical protein
MALEAGRCEMVFFLLAGEIKSPEKLRNKMLRCLHSQSSKELSADLWTKSVYCSSRIFYNSGGMD